ncbi:MAG: amino acid--tRNA ligase-related protein [Patescibacteria group bacterium]|jgi:aspartyl-tRNA synthetase
MKRTLVIETIKSVNQQVRLCGWVRTARRLGKMVFIDLWDVSGLAQVVFLSDKKDLLEQAKQLRPEFVVEIIGQVNNRPAKLVNKDMPTGAVEIQALEMKILSSAKTPPFEIVETDKEEPGEELRFKYRYLDLRRMKNQRRIIIRSKAIKFIRDFLHEAGFIEIETPILAKSTPEGARDYLVPSRQYPGKFYALPQSPQQYKQMLMVAGFDKYFQIAPCFRDEDARADRAPDQFYQLDMEMSFISQSELLDLTEKLFTKLISDLFPEKHLTFTPWPRITFDEAMKKYGSDKPDMRKDKNDPNELAFCYVIDWPFFEPEKKDGKYVAFHHIFTAPRTEDLPLLETAPAKVRSWQHDLVLNGYEVGGGSIRTTDPKVLEKIMELVGVSREEAKVQFGHMLEAFEYGVPPHGGFAPGIDRLLMILLSVPNVREVVAFPKTGDNREPMTGSPSEVDEKQLRDLQIRIDKK